MAPSPRARIRLLLSFGSGDWHIRDDVDTAVTRRELASRTSRHSRWLRTFYPSESPRTVNSLSVSLLDNTLKVFFADSFKFFLSLYGHRLPALCHDVSNDAQLLVQGVQIKICVSGGLTSATVTAPSSRIMTL